MNGELYEVKEIIKSHDKAIEHLVDVMADTNKEIKELTVAISNQNILFEKFNNMDMNTKASISRVTTRLEKIEDVYESKGCNASTLAEEKIKMVNKRLDKLENNQTWAVRIVIGFILLGILGSGITFGIN